MNDLLEHRRIVQAESLVLLPANWWPDEPEYPEVHPEGHLVRPGHSAFIGMLLRAGYRQHARRKPSS
jgi:hypothetical protein